MRRGTTPTYVMNFSTGDGAKIDDISITFAQGTLKLHAYLHDGKIVLDGDTASVTLLQEDTKLFSAGYLNRQVKVKLKEEYGSRVLTSEIVNETVYEQLNEAVL